MVDIIQNFSDVSHELDKTNAKPIIIAVSKTHSMEHIQPLLDYGHRVFGENKVQEAKQKWEKALSVVENLELHLIGKLQSNKAKDAVKIFHYIHSLDSTKLAEELSKYEKKLNLQRKYFVQVNVGEEKQKSGIITKDVSSFVDFCINEKKLNVLGLMCIPPFDLDPIPFFQIVSDLNKQLQLPLLSMGMSNDYVDAAKLGSTHVRVGSKIFGARNYQ
jgi:pyridoxal phosphate enzyme (YggS family)